MGVLSEREDEETDGEEICETHGADQPILWDWDACVLLGRVVVHGISPKSGTEANEATENECKVW
jgi:hypothetical protein